MRNIILAGVGAILALSTNASRKMRMVIAADNIWTLSVTDAAGNSQQLGRVNDWNKITTIEQLLTGPGPWTLTAFLVDYGVISGFYNALWIDGQPFSQTSTDGTLNKWQIYNTKKPPVDDSGLPWTNPAYNPTISAQGWKENFASTPDCVDYHSRVWGMDQRMAEATAFDTAPLTQPVLPLWFPTCQSINEKQYYRMVIPAGDQANVVAPSYPPIERIPGRNIEMVMTVDNSYSMSITDNDGNTTPWSSSSNWNDINLYRKTLLGSGPWTITVAAVDYGVVSGFFATNWVDGSLFSVTGADGSSNKWEIWPAVGPSFAEPPSDGKFAWTHPRYRIAKAASYPSMKWIKNHKTTSDCDPNSYPQSFWTRLNAASSPVKMGQIWYPNCKSINVKQYFRLVIPAAL